MQAYRLRGVLTFCGESEYRQWFETSGITDATTKIGIPEGLNPYPYRWENFKLL